MTFETSGIQEDATSAFGTVKQELDAICRAAYPDKTDSDRVGGLALMTNLDFSGAAAIFGKLADVAKALSGRTKITVEGACIGSPAWESGMTDTKPVGK